MKGILYFFGICLLIGLVVSFTFTRLPVLPMSGKGILILFEQNKYSQAYGYFSKDFQHKYPLPVFTKMVQDSGLTNYKDVEWFKNNLDKNSKRGVLTGMVKTKQSALIYIEMDFVEQPNAWGGTGWVIQDLRVKKNPDRATTLAPAH